jgi:hypothetical protein
VIAWRAVIDTTPKCPRCNRETSYPSDGIENVFHVPCDDPLCDVPSERHLSVTESVDGLARAALIELRTTGQLDTASVLADLCEERGASKLAEALRPANYERDYTRACRDRALRDVLAGTWG